MTGDKNQPLRPRRKRWLRRIAIVACVVFGLAAIFHRPLIFFGLKYFAARFAKKQHLDLQCEISGSIFTSLTITNLRAIPTEPGLVERLEFGTLKLRYSFLRLIRQGWPAVLQDIDLRDAIAVIDPTRKPPKRSAKSRIEWPDFFPERANLANINFISRSPRGDLELKGLYFDLGPEAPGALKIQALQIPGTRRRDAIAATTTFRDRNLVLGDLSLGTEITLKRFSLDVSKIEKREVAVATDGTLFGGPVSLAAKVTDLNKSNLFNVRADLAGFAIGEVANYFNLKTPLLGKMNQLAIAFDGAASNPAGWTGEIQTQFDGVVFEEQSLGAVAAKMNFANGRVTVAASNQIDAKNKLTLAAEAALPGSMAALVRTDASGTLDVAMADIAPLTKKFPQPMRGDLAGRVNFKLSNGKLVANTTIDSTWLTAADVELTKSNFSIRIEKSIAEREGPMFANLVTQTRGSVASLRFADYTADEVSCAFASRDAAVTLEKLTLTKEGNSADIQGSYTLPGDLQSWASAPLAVTIAINAPDLSALVVPGSATKLAGALTVHGHSESVKGRHNGAFTIAGKAIDYNGLAVRDLGGDVNIINSIAHVPDFSVVFDGKNVASIGGEIALAPSFKYSAWAEAKLGDLSKLETLLGKPENKSQPLGGALALSWRGSGEVRPAKHSGSAVVDLVRGRFRGQQNLSAHFSTDYSPDRVNIPDLRAAATQGEMQTKVRWENKRLAVKDLVVRQAGRTVIGGSLDLPLDLLAPQKTLDALVPADAPVNAALSSKDVDLKTLFEQFGLKPRVLGILNANISASGTRGKLVASANIRANKLQPAAEGSFTPADMALDFGLAGNQLKLTTNLEQGKVTLLEGTAELPVDIAHTTNLDLLFPDDGPVKIALVSRDLNLATIYAQFVKPKPPEKAKPQPKTARLRKPDKSKTASLTGTMNTTIAAGGTVGNLLANVSVRAVKLQSTAAENFAPADAALDLTLSDRRLKLSGTVTQRDMKPLVLGGDLPFDVAALKKSRRLDGRTPVELHMDLPRSPLGFVSSLVPAIRFIEGTAAIGMKAGGTLANPELSGAMQADIRHLRFRNTSVPPMNDATVRIDLARDRITIQQCKGGLGGGSFAASGGITLERFTEPNFDVRIRTHEALMMQDDNLTARVTSDLHIAGPLKAGTVSGSVLVTKSRFFKDIDILPIGLPGRPAPQPAPEPVLVTFPKPPLRDWKFDVTVKTNDPILIQGNLANGRTLIDLKLAGTGLKPWLDGSVSIAQLMTSLPYSRLEIVAGNVYFTPDKPFLPQLDIRAESTVRDYKITVYIFGNTSAPQTIFTSEPPLSQNEIVALLATGVTAKEIADDPNALAGRAGVFVAQKMFRKLFKKSEPSQPKDTPFKNVDVEVGGTDPRSGQQTVQIRMPLTEQLVLTGGVDVGGNFRGQLKYLLRFK
jgi:autotransporter translocation and assembly factor TamB